jgi:L-aminopeptidase/D-esterase-like protein
MPRIRDFGIIPGVLPVGIYNAITDVPGVRVSHTTVNRDVNGVCQRTGVTAIWPHSGKVWRERVYAATFHLNGYGEMTARTLVDEWGTLDFPIMLTGTNNVGIVCHWTCQYLFEHGARAALGLARTGSTARDSSGEIIVAFATGNILRASDGPETTIRTLVEGAYGSGTSPLNALFTAAIEATEEAVYNALVSATTTNGVDGHVLRAIPHDRLREVIILLTVTIPHVP